MGTDTPLPSTPKKAHTDNSNAASGSNHPTLPSLGNTPISLKNAPHVSGADYSVEVSRNAVASDLGVAIPEVEFEFFKLHILPPLHLSIDIDTIISDLVDDEIIVNGRWAAFPRDPWTYATDSSGVAQREKENEVFAPLATIIREITSSKRTGVHARRALEYESLPDSTPVCCFDKKGARPDGYFVFNTPNQPAMRFNGRAYWRDLATPAEFKLRDRREDLQGDINQICWDMHQIMREDPNRRFVFGFTIENIRMRIWMMNRSEVVVSQPFNFITDHKKFLHFFLSQTYASAHELGADPTMTLVKASTTGECIYDITVHDVKGKSEGEKPVPIVFRTAGLINDDGTKSPLGRGTRVWRVRRLVDGKPDATAPGRVLKDSWVDEDREREGNILQQIIGQPDISDTVRKALVALFLTAVAFGDVVIGGCPDGTRSLITRGADVPDTNMFSMEAFGHISSHKRGTTSSSLLLQCSTIPASDNLRRKVIKYFKKRHYRIVFAEECEPLSKTTSLHDVFTSLLRMTNGLFILHQSGPGWVHRDLSTGNILYDREKTRWVLSDVEYAKRLDVKTAHEIRTGTANFMAVEVDIRVYLHRSRTKSNVQQDPFSRLNIEDLAARMLTQEDSTYTSGTKFVQQIAEQKSESKQIFYYNPTHDLESLWWIAVYFVINKETFLRPPSGSTITKLNQSNSDTLNINHRNSAALPVATSIDPGMAQPALGSDRNNEYQVVSYLDKNQRAYSRSLFYSKEPRILALSGSSGGVMFEAHMNGLPAHLFDLGRSLNSLRENLRSHYFTIESPGYEIDKLVCSRTELYSQFMEAFSSMANVLSTQDIMAIPFRSDGYTIEPPQSTAKDLDHTSVSSANDNYKRKLRDNAQNSAGSSASKKPKHESPQLTESSEASEPESADVPGKGKAVAR
ncbi:hypothetical protein BDY19DRAFT_923656 [Irpex rosettiformis]|uniref:Uncharacterized protein n=1 Tax=Irpex rosettiformis TaxID=378272 RepID=A0ACB8UGX9_9APHY|nr:hypothetical protein BDY19DRAFT_923656 [Irpex rosettiformis]